MVIGYIGPDKRACVDRTHQFPDRQLASSPETGFEEIGAHFLEPDFLPA
jgi:hypothetical protein